MLRLCDWAQFQLKSYNIHQFEWNLGLFQQLNIFAFWNFVILYLIQSCIHNLPPFQIIAFYTQYILLAIFINNKLQKSAQMRTRRQKSKDMKSKDKDLELQPNLSEVEKKKSGRKNYLNCQKKKKLRVNKQEIGDAKDVSDKPEAQQSQMKKFSEKYQHIKEEPVEKAEKQEKNYEEPAADEKEGENKETNPNNPQQSDQRAKVPKKSENEKKEQKKKNKNCLPDDKDPFKIADAKAEKDGNLASKNFGIFTSQLPAGTNLFNYQPQFFNNFPISKTPLCFSSNDFQSKKIFGDFSQIKLFVASPEQGNEQKQKIQEQIEEDDNNQDKNSQALKKEQQIEIDASKSTGMYNYQDSPIHFQSGAEKLKKLNGQIIDNIEILIQSNQQNKIYWLTARLLATKVPILSGFIVKNKTEIRYLGGKAQNVAISVLVKKKDGKICCLSETQNVEKVMQVLKIKFENDETGDKFLNLIREIVQSL